MTMILHRIAIVINTKGAFLQGKFTNNELMHMEVLDRMEKVFGSRQDVALL